MHCVFLLGLEWPLGKLHPMGILLGYTTKPAQGGLITAEYRKQPPKTI
jgi:hypothetical protein